MARNKYSPRSHFALSIVPNPGNTKMNKASGDFEFNMEIDLQMVTQNNEEKQ